MFGAFAIFAIVLGVRNRIHPGQDYHYHLMTASFAARGWTGDADIGRLYELVNPLDANTLLYTLLFPLELVCSPVRAFTIGITLFCFVGYPVACLVALRMLRRPVWGALLAFPLIYVRSWSHGGFIPFLLAAPLMVLALGSMHRLQVAISEGERIRPRTFAVVAVSSALAFLAHAHVYSWLMFVLALATVWMMASRLAANVWSPAYGARSAVRVGVLSLAAVGPSLVLFTVWYVRTHFGGHAAASTRWDIPPDTWQGRLSVVMPSLTLATDETEWKLVAVFLILCVFAFLVAGTPRDRHPTPEIALLATIASFFLLPWLVSLQSVAPRQIDIGLFLLPLAIYPGPARTRVRGALVTVAMCAFGIARMAWISPRLSRLQGEVGGLFEMAKPCPPRGKEIAYVTFHPLSRHWHAQPMHQAHETLAAICRLDTPIYDSRVYPYNFVPLRYRQGLPAPITILVEDAHWFERPRLWEDFDLVLVHAWSPTEAELVAIDPFAERVRVSGEWQLWRSKRR
ncbi:MAG TPA: hypothetical protein VM925_26180 [Labilithrix sp.]|nr:hypothetical protein [Labilithrix sp.]